MSLVALLTALAAATFLITMICLSGGRPGTSHVTGVAYHVLLLPVVAALPAPAWAQAAGYGWLLIDIVIGGAQVAKLDPRIAHQFRSGAHLPAAIWVAGAAFSGAWWLAVVGALFAIVQAGGTLLVDVDTPMRWRFWTPAVLNIAWMIAVAVALA